MFGSRPPSDACLSNLAFDQLLGQELDEAGRAAALAHAAGCSRCAARLRELEAARDEFRAAPPSFSSPAPARASKPRSAARRTALAGAGALAAAALALLLVRAGAGVDPGGPDDRGDPGDPAGAPNADSTRAKGDLRLVVYIKREGAVLEGRSGDPVHPGEAIRFAYSSPVGGYLVILSRDGAGEVSVYYPEGERAAPIAAAQDELLPGSIILDEVLGPEEIVALRCAEPIPVGEAAAALRRSQAIADRLAGCTVERVILDKRP